ncbi:MAG: hypothetical protein Q9159_003982 [Coniocarpon cinnabarinum]
MDDFNAQTKSLACLPAPDGHPFHFRQLRRIQPARTLAVAKVLSMPAPQTQASTELGNKSLVQFERTERAKTIYILGTGSIGKFVAHSLMSSPAPPPVTLLFHKSSYLYDFRKPENRSMLHLTTHGTPNATGPFASELVLPERKPDRHGMTNLLDLTGRRQTEKRFPDATSDVVIEHLVITTKAHQTVKSLLPLRHRLTRDSTLLFLQNGCGTVEEVNRYVFPYPEDRPNYLVGINSHGVHGTGATSAVHAGHGVIYMGFLPRDHWTPENESNASSPRAGAADGDKHLPDTARYLLRSFTHLPVLAAMTVPPSTLILHQLDKLAVNCVVNPLTVLLDAPNGSILKNSNISRTMRLLLFEISAIFRRLPEVQGLPNVDVRFSPDRLEDLVVGVAKKTSANISSMLQDVRRGAETEIEYLNGWVVRRGESVGVKAVVNYSMVTLVKGKQTKPHASFSAYSPAKLLEMSRQAPHRYADIMHENEDFRHNFQWMKDFLTHDSNLQVPASVSSKDEQGGTQYTRLAIVDLLEDGCQVREFRITSRGPIGSEERDAILHTGVNTGLRFILWQSSSLMALNPLFLDHLGLSLGLDPYFVSAHLMNDSVVALSQEKSEPKVLQLVWEQLKNLRAQDTLLEQLSRHPMDLVALCLEHRLSTSSTSMANMPLSSSMGRLDLGEISHEEEQYRFQCTASQLERHIVSMRLSQRALICYQGLTKSETLRLSPASYTDLVYKFDILLKDAELYAKNLNSRLQMAASKASIQQAKRSLRESASMRRQGFPLTVQLNGGHLGFNSFVAVVLVATFVLGVTIALIPAYEATMARGRREAGLRHGFLFDEELQSLPLLEVVGTLVQHSWRGFCARVSNKMNGLLGRSQVKDHPA